MIAIGYTRISVKDQSTYSLDNQERAIRAYCETNKLQLLTIFKDDGESSYTFDRPDFKALEAFIKKNKSVQYLIIFDHDRFSRNLADALNKIKEFQTKFGITVLATTDPFGIDFTDPTNFMMRAFKLMMAEGELHRIRQRTRAGVIQANLSGRIVNKAPYGYVNAKDTAGKPVLKIEEEKAFIVRTIFSEYNRGCSIEQVRAAVAPLGYRQKGQSAIQRILSNPVYAGLIRVPAYAGKPEQIVKGLHAGIVTEAQFWQAQAKLFGNKKTAVHSNQDVWLKGVLKGPSGRPVSAGNSKGKKGKYYWYYVQQEDRKHLSANKLHQQMNEILDLLSYDRATIEWYTKKLGEEITQRLGQRAELQAATGKALRAVMDRIAMAEERYLSEETMNKVTFTKTKARLRKEQADLQRRMVELSRSESEHWQKLNELLPKLYDIRGAFEELSLAKKQQFLNLVFDNSLSHDGTLYRTPFLHPMFAHNEQALKEKGLLVVEQPSGNLEQSPGRTGNGTIIELFSAIADIFAA